MLSSSNAGKLRSKSKPKQLRKRCFDREFSGGGRINNSSGTKKLSEFRRRDVILMKLFERGELNMLTAFKEGRISIEELVNANRNDKLNVLAERVAPSQRRALKRALLDTVAEFTERKQIGLLLRSSDVTKRKTT